VLEVTLPAVEETDLHALVDGAVKDRTLLDFFTLILQLVFITRIRPGRVDLLFSEATSSDRWLGRHPLIRLGFGLPLSAP
jgi:hypothetical protein